MKIKVGTRPSRLAFEQVKEIQGYFREVVFDVIAIETYGDKDKVTPLVFREGSDFFTYEIERSLVDGKIDVAIHSAKDLEQNPPQQLAVIATTKTISPFDCLVSKENLSLDKLLAGACIGTSSRRRKEAIAKYRPDLVTKDIRGNIDERLAQLDRGSFDAIVIAEAALIRLGLGKRISQCIPFDIVAPHPLQGRLAIQALRDRKDLFEIFKRINEN